MKELKNVLKLEPQNRIRFSVFVGFLYENRKPNSVFRFFGFFVWKPKTEFGLSVFFGFLYENRQNRQKTDK